MNRLELCNDYLVLTSCTFLFAYSDGLMLIKNPGYPNPEFPEYDEALPDMESKYQLGWYNIGVLGLLVVINFVCMLTVQVHKIYSQIRMMFLKYRHKKRMQEYAARLELKKALDSLIKVDVPPPSNTKERKIKKKKD